MKNHLFYAFQSRPFTLLWLSEIFTQIPVHLFNFLLILIVYNLTKSNTAVSGVVLTFTLPAVFFGILAGIYIDRWNKRLVLLITNTSRALLLLLLAIFPENIILIYIISSLISIITQFFIPAESPIIPLLVKENQLLSANALFGIGIFGSMMVAYLLSGPLVLLLGTVNTLLLLSFMMFLGAWLIYFIKVPPSEEKKGFDPHHLRIPFKIVMKELKDVFSIIISTRQVASSLFLLAMSQILILIIASVAPGYASEVLKINVEQFPLLVITPATIGIIMGALAIANIFHSTKKDTLVLVGIFLSSFAMIVMPYGNKLLSRPFIQTFNTAAPSFLNISNLDIIVVLSFILGFANALVFVPSNTILQEKTTDEVRGKIYGVLNSLIGIFSFIPILAVGSFSDLIGVGRVLVGIGICLLLIGVVKLLIK